MMQNSYDGQQGQDDGGDGWVDNAGNEGDGDDEGHVGGCSTDGWADNPVRYYGGYGGGDVGEVIDDLIDRVSELQECIRELTEALQPN